MANPAKESWYETNVFQARVIRSTIWTVMMSLLWFIIITFISVLLHDPLHPLTAFIFTLQQFFSLSSIFFILIFISTTVWSSVKHSENFSVTPTVFHSWSKVLYSLVLPSTATSLVQYTVHSTAIAWCSVHLGWPQYSSLVSSTGTISQYHIFVLGSGTCTGLYLGTRYQVYSDNWVSFPLIYKDISSQMKQQIKPLLSDSVKQALHIMKYYYALYFTLNLLLSSSFPMAPISSFFSISLFLAVLSVTTLIIVMNSTKLKIFSVFLTAPLPSLSTDQLLSSLSPSPPLLHLLSLQHLARLTATSPSIRSTIFSLSQPGGHPHNWKTVSQACLATVDSISTSITSLSSSAPPTVATAKPQTTQPIIASNMRRLAPNSGAKLEDVPLPPRASPATQLVSFITSMTKSLKKQPVVSLLFKVQPDAQLRTILCRSQAAIWSVDILTYLVAKSITEDKFGVVQRDLPGILTSLLTLDQKLSGPKKLGVSKEADVKLKHELKGAVKAGLYRIAIQFGDHVQAIPLNRELNTKMMNYQKLLEA